MVNALKSFYISCFSRQSKITFRKCGIFFKKDDNFFSNENQTPIQIDLKKKKKKNKNKN